MSVCVLITCAVNIMATDFLESIAHHARNVRIEGFVARVAGDSAHTLRIIACGTRESIDSLVDILHEQGVPYGMHDLQIEPFSRDKDYRGAFRVII